MRLAEMLRIHLGTLKSKDHLGDFYLGKVVRREFRGG